MNLSKLLHRSAFSTIVMLLLNLNLFAQQQEIKGTLRSSLGEQLAGVTVTIKGATRSVITDTNGAFTIYAPTGSTLVFSSVGFQGKEVKVTGRNINEILQVADNTLNEVVVIGYGTQKKGEVTSAISSVSAKDFVKGAVRDAGQLIQGKVAGLSVSTPSGDPTAGTQIMLRGISSVLSSSQPLILVDGIPGALNTVAPEDIQSIDILKDGSAAAIYGTRGSNGVILITTKKNGSDRKPGLEYSSYVSTQSIARQLHLLNVDDYRRLKSQGVNFEDLGGNTDWVKQISRQPISHTHNLTLSGGNAISSYTASVNYRNWQGLFKRSDNKQLIGRISLNHSMFENRLKFNVNTIIRNTRYWEGGDGMSFNTNIYRQAIIRNPTDMLKDSSGAWQERDTYDYINPVGSLMEADGENDKKEMRLTASVIFTPIKDLNLKLLGANTMFTQMRGYYETKNNVSTTKYGRNGYASTGSTDTRDNLLELTADYSKSFGDHRFTILSGYSYQDQTYQNSYIQNWDFPTDLYTYNNIYTGNALRRGEANVGSLKNASKLIGNFARLNYNFDERYLLMASLRREGSTKFGENYQWGNFPAVSIGWRISRESFMQSLNFIHNLKIRAGFGVTGTIPDQPYLSQVSLNYGARYLNNGVWVQSIEPVRNPNPDLRWERKNEVNLGIDFSLLNDRLSGSIDFYRRKTKDMLYEYPVPVPPYLFPSIIANVGEMENKGLEVFLQFVPVQTNQFRWNANFTYSTNKNKLVSISNDKFQTTNDFLDFGDAGSPITTSTHRVKVGGPIGDFFGYRTIDIDQNGQWIIEGADGKPKNIKDAVYADKHVLGNGLPKHYIGFNNSFQYKNIDLSVNIRAALGFQILNFQRMYYENPRFTEYNRLSTAFDKIYGKAVLASDLEYVSYYLEDGDFLKIDNVTLGYKFNVKKDGLIKAARVYANGLNLVTITGYKGIDPEVNRLGLSPGNDELNKYPTTRTFTFGINFNF